MTLDNESRRAMAIFCIFCAAIFVFGLVLVYVNVFPYDAKSDVVPVTFAIVQVPPNTPEFFTVQTICWVDNTPGDFGTIFKVSPDVTHTYRVECWGANDTLLKNFTGDFWLPRLAENPTLIGGWFVILLDWNTTAGTVIWQEGPHYGT